MDGSVLVRGFLALLVLLVATGAADTHAQTGTSRPVLELALEADIKQAHPAEAELARLQDEMQVVREDDPVAPGLLRKYRELQLRAARLKQAAIQRAIDAYAIDVSKIGCGVSYSPHGDMREREAATFLDQDGTVRVEIGDLAFGSAAELGSTIGHEVEVHVNRQIAKGVHYPMSDEQGWLIQELEAYDYELANKDRYGLSADEVNVLKTRRAIFYRRLQWDHRQRADVGKYTK